MSAESLLKPGMKFIPLTRTDHTRLAENAREDSGRMERKMTISSMSAGNRSNLELIKPNSRWLLIVSLAADKRNIDMSNYYLLS